jgi:hypothetical protein
MTGIPSKLSFSCEAGEIRQQVGTAGPRIQIVINRAYETFKVVLHSSVVEFVELPGFS